jgi:hypothetical protein
MPRLPTLLALFLTLAASHATLAASVAQAAGEAAAEIPACPLLTPDEVVAAFGKPVAVAEQPPVGGAPGAGRMTTCFWTPADGGLGTTLSLVVWSWPSGHPAAAGSVEAVRLADLPDRPAPVDVAVGDEAVWDGDRLHARKGNVGFTLAASLNALDPTPDAEAKLVALGEKVAARLP